MRVAVIGAGPSGLVTLKYLATAHEFFPGMKPVDVRLFEAEDQIGGTFRYRTYEDGEVCPGPVFSQLQNPIPSSTDLPVLSCSLALYAPCSHQG